MKRIFISVIKVFKYMLMSIGLLFIIFIILSFTSIPFWAYHWLGTSNSELSRKPDYIVLLGAGGMPSPEGFMRVSTTASVAKQYQEAKIILAMPTDDTVFNKHSSMAQMYYELILRGVDSSRIKVENTGINTYNQVKNIMHIIDRNNDSVSICVVTSPEHMYRSVKCFRAQGIVYVGGIPSFEKVESEKVFLNKKCQSDPDSQDVMALSVRYNMWNYLKYQIVVIREVSAILYYKIKGWI